MESGGREREPHVGRPLSDEQLVRNCHERTLPACRGTHAISRTFLSCLLSNGGMAPLGNTILPIIGSRKSEVGLDTVDH